MTTICRKVIVSEVGRTLGWNADCELLRSMSDDGWDPVSFEIKDDGLVIEFELVNHSGPSPWSYDCNQEGGSIPFTVSTLDNYARNHDLEAIFCFRAGVRGAERDGSYVRFFCRRNRAESSSGGVGEVKAKWEHKAIACKRRPRKALVGGWTLIGVINDWDGKSFTGRRLGIYKRRVD